MNICLLHINGPNPATSISVQSHIYIVIAIFWENNEKAVHFEHKQKRSLDRRNKLIIHTKIKFCFYARNVFRQKKTHQ